MGSATFVFYVMSYESLGITSQVIVTVWRWLLLVKSEHQWPSPMPRRAYCRTIIPLFWPYVISLFYTRQQRSQCLYKTCSCTVLCNGLQCTGPFVLRKNRCLWGCWITLLLQPNMCVTAVFSTRQMFTESRLHIYAVVVNECTSTNSKPIDSMVLGVFEMFLCESVEWNMSRPLLSPITLCIPMLPNIPHANVFTTYFHLLLDFTWAQGERSSRQQTPPNSQADTFWAF